MLKLLFESPVIATVTCESKLLSNEVEIPSVLSSVAFLCLMLCFQLFFKKIPVQTGTKGMSQPVQKPGKYNLGENAATHLICQPTVFEP